MQAFKRWWNAFEDKHTTAAQFIVFFILSNGIESKEALPGQVNCHVGSPTVRRSTFCAQASSLSERTNRALFREVDVRQHPRGLQDSGELNLAPRAARAA